jgi:hypothetical protein
MDLLAGRPEQRSLFDLSDITDDQFFDEAETKVIEALRIYAEKTQNGDRLQRRLFAEDAVRGFGFVDLCRTFRGCDQEYSRLVSYRVSHRR